jgi:hypothetical protein
MAGFAAGRRWVHDNGLTSIGLPDALLHLRRADRLSPKQEDIGE